MSHERGESASPDAPRTPRTLRRRELLAAGATAGAGLALAGPLNWAALARRARTPLAGEVDFAHVAAGLPSPRAITLWTRVNDGIRRSSRLQLEVSTDPDFRRVVERRMVLSNERRDFAVHEHVTGLKPDTEYHYRFHTPDSESRVGRFRTAPPPDSKRPIRIGFFSCQAYEAGYFTAHAALAAEHDLDLVICLGDYIYEHLFYVPDGPEHRRDRTGRNGDGEAQHLDEFREKYRHYQNDPELADMHAAHPFVAIWDDHEVEDNWAGDGPDATSEDPGVLTNSGIPRTVPFLRRRQNGFRAFFEAMPRIPRSDDRYRIWESAGIGALVDLIALDTRRYRDPQPCGGELIVPCPSAGDPGRTILGAEQKQWLKRRLAGSTATWKLLANQVMLMGLESAPSLTLNVDGWDGYAAEREEILTHALDNGVQNIVSLTGDIHTFFAGTVTTSGNILGTPVATELVGGSITSPGVPELLGLPPELPNDTIAQILRVNNPHLTYLNVARRGYGVLTVTPSEVICEMRGMATVHDPESARFTLAKLRIPAGDPVVERV